ncbi:MAG: dephospho-CoA kinase [Acidimicrobiales bacterium]
MVVVGLTGGIGSGKSTVARLLAELGAVVIDADVVAREVTAPGGPAHDQVLERFGPRVLRGDGSIDRPALAALVFDDPAARHDLNRIVHPAVGAEVLGRLTLIAAAAAADPEAIVVLDIPLLAEVGRESYPVAGVIVVDAPVEVAVARLVAGRGFTEDEARARAAAQATREQRRVIADLVIDNSGELDHLRAEVDRAWAWVQGLVVPSGS